ncbi:MAG TPA: DinB family protein [Candidatus Limnocylindria bacterium]
MKPSDPELRTQLARLLDGDDAHMRFEHAVADFPDDAINAFPPNVPYTPWHLVEHLRITQRDILDYVRDPAYASPPWPSGYWPRTDATASPLQFDDSVRRFLDDRAALRAMVTDEALDLAAPMPHTPGHSLAREIRICADHNAYLRQVMNTWGATHA